MSAPRPSTKESIREAAARLFPVHGYTGTSVRDIASAAGVDPALVIRHFGSKEELFLETMQLDDELHPLLDAPLEGFGERFIDYLLSEGDRVRSVYLALIRASESEGVVPRLRQMHDSAFVEPLQARLEGPDAELRARLAAAVVGGLLYALWVVRDEQLLAADRSDIVTRYGGLVQTIITPTA